MTLDRDRLVAVIMAGGGGTRFWPRSRKEKPKQFLAFDGAGSLLRQTVDRLDGLIPRSRILVITGREHVDMAREHAGLPAENVVGEPCGRDTAACVGLGALLARRIRPDAVMVVLAADHLVDPVDVFRDAIVRAAEMASSSDAIVTMGIRPVRPATGYGYIETGEKVDGGSPTAYEVLGFLEKPDLETARRFLLDGRYLWNSGNLVFRAEHMLEALQQHLPGIHSALMSLRDPADPDELDRVYPKLEKISIDYGVLERTDCCAVVEAPFEWDDLGTFEAVARRAEAKGDGNLARGDAMFVDGRGSFVDNDCEGLVVVCGLDDVLVVRTADAVLVMPRKRAEDVKEIVAQLDRQGFGKRL